MQKRKRIAVLLGTAEELYQAQFLEGFLEQAFSYDYDVCVFAMYQKYQKTKERGIGETSIFYLIDYDKFDGVILMLDTIQTPGMAKKIEDMVKKQFTGPVLCVDTESDVFPWIEMEYYFSAKRMVNHLIEVHDIKDIAYITGFKGHKHSEERLSAYKDCMAEHGLEVPENRIFYGDFWYYGGSKAVETIIENGWDMPRAFACANDFMAMGAAKALVKNGYKIPEEVAVVGYDSVEEGKSSPKKITSLSLPRREYGTHVARSLKAMFDGKELPVFDIDVDLFIGGSCGCEVEEIITKEEVSGDWENSMSERDFFSLTNYMNVDMLCQTNFYDLMKTLSHYTYHIRDFETFHICLNEDWDDFEKKVLEGREDERFSSRMFHVVNCDIRNEQGEDISFDSYFDTKDMLPELYEERKKPAAFYFTPLHFEEKCFGYAVVSYGDQLRTYNSRYRMWLQNVMQELECFRRIEAVEKAHRKLENSMIRDSLTGLYNYNGFLKQMDFMLRRILQNEYHVGVLATDIKGLMKISDQYGRTEGDHVINTVANLLKDHFPGSMCICLGNGEMITVVMSHKNIEEEMTESFSQMSKQLEKLSLLNAKGYNYGVYYGIETGTPRNKEEMERLANMAVLKKNAHKVSEDKYHTGDKLTHEEMIEAKIVKKLLDNNEFRYHFQPIVSAKTGEIFGYEALMRADVSAYLPPTIILKYAEHYGRLYDVEKATFFNVLDIVKKKPEIFAGHTKVFINSIPGNLLHGDEAAKLEELSKELKDTVVVELTEQTELADSELKNLKELYEKLGFKTAIDDYGTGYSNVNNLLRYMPNVVKIDRMLLSDIQNSPQKQHFVKDIVTYAHDNNILALAEGVETVEELQMVIKLEVDLIQGYYTARPAADIIPSIHGSVKSEILEFNRIEKQNRGRRVYEVETEKRISIARLVAEKYSIIEISKEASKIEEIIIAGVLDSETDMNIHFKNGYHGRVVLENVFLQGAKQGACIELGNDCEVELVLLGENKFLNGGIKVPENAKLTLLGDGHLQIHVDGANYFGIGNDMDEKHGALLLQQDGIIEIKGSGMKGVAIGSGLGGPITIEKGKYIIKMIGQDAVGIGSLHGDMDSQINNCDVRIEISTANAVGVGSMSGSVNVEMDHLAWISELNADKALCIGTFGDKKCSAKFSYANIMMNMLAYSACGVGSKEGEVDLELDNGSIYISGDGVDAIAVGNEKKSGKIKIVGGRIESRLKTDSPTDLGVKEENIFMERANVYYTKKGKRAVLKE